MDFIIDQMIIMKNFTIDQMIILMISAYKDNGTYSQEYIIYRIKQCCSIFGVCPEPYILNELNSEDKQD